MDKRSLSPNGQEGLRWLEEGDSRQREIARQLQSSGILTKLADYSPSVAGTFPIGLDIPGSDIDLLCEVYDHRAFMEQMQVLFGEEPDFYTEQGRMNGEAYSTVRFRLGELPIELFGQGRPVSEQNGCRHMIAEYRLLAGDQPSALEDIRALKLSGMKTEPAFAEYYGLLGNPYEVLYELSTSAEQELRQIVANKPRYIL